MYSVNNDYQWVEGDDFNHTIIRAHDLDSHPTRHCINYQYVLGSLTRFQHTYLTDAQTLYPEARQAPKFHLLMIAVIISR